MRSLTNNQHGAVLLAVVMAISLVALLAFAMNSTIAINMGAGANETARRNALAVARAGMAHGKWQLVTASCPDSLVLNQSFGPHSYSFTAATNPNNTIHLVSVAMMSDNSTSTLREDFQCAPFETPMLYWTDKNQPSITMAELNGIDPSPVSAPGLRRPDEIKTDWNGKRLFWVDEDSSGDDIIMRANLDGSNATVIVPCSWSCSIRALAVDQDDDDIFWLQNSRIRHADKEGNNSETILSGLDAPSDLDLDPQAREIYWLEEDAGELRSISYNGSDETVIRDDLGKPLSLAVDSDAGMVYWYDNEEGIIYRAPLDGSGNMTEVVDAGGEDLTGMRIALAPTEGMVYWTDPDQGMLRAAKMDGSSTAPQNIMTGLSSSIRGITVGPLP